MTNTSGNTTQKTATINSSSGQAGALVRNNAQVAVNRQGQGAGGGGHRPPAAPFRQTLNNPSMFVDDIPQKGKMFQSPFCLPPCPMPMCCPPPYCFPCPAPCMPRPMCPFPCNPWCPPQVCCPPCFPPPMQCCPPPMPCCPPSPCCPPAIKKCCCIGNKRIICIPRGKSIMCSNNSCCDPCTEKPACYNNCNFYVSETSQPEQCPCPCPEPPCEPEGVNTTPGDDRIFPAPRRDSRVEEVPPDKYRVATTAAASQTKEPRKQLKPATGPSKGEDIEIKISSNVNVSIDDEDNAGTTSNVKNAKNNPTVLINPPRIFIKDATGKSVTPTIHTNSDVSHIPTATGQTHIYSSKSTLANPGSAPLSGNESLTRGFTSSSKEDDYTDMSDHLEPPHRTDTFVTQGNSGTTIRIASDTSVRVVVNRGNSGTTVRETTPTAGPPSTAGATVGSSNPGGLDDEHESGHGTEGSRRKPDSGKVPESEPGTDGRRRKPDSGKVAESEPGTDGRRKKPDGSKVPESEPGTSGSHRRSPPGGNRPEKKQRTNVDDPQDNDSSRLEGEPETNVKVRATRVPKSVSDPETTTKHRKLKKKKKKKQKKRSKSIPEVSQKKKQKKYPPFRDIQLGGGYCGRPVRTIYERDCSTACPWNDPCDYSYRPIDPCRHRDTPTINSPCGLCYRDYDICTAVLRNVKWPLNLRTPKSSASENSRPMSPEVACTWRRARERSRSSTQINKAYYKRWPHGLPMPSPSDISTCYSNTRRFSLKPICSKNSIESDGHFKKHRRQFRMRYLYDLNMNRSSTSNPMLTVKITQSLLNVSERKVNSGCLLPCNSRSLNTIYQTTPLQRSFPMTQMRPVKEELEILSTVNPSRFEEVMVMPLQYKVEEFNEKCWQPCVPPPPQSKVNVVDLKPPPISSNKSILPKKLVPRVVPRLWKLKTSKKQVKSMKSLRICCPPNDKSLVKKAEPCLPKKSKNCIEVQVTPDCCDMSTGPSPASSAITDLCPDEAIQVPEPKTPENTEAMLQPIVEQPPPKPKQRKVGHCSKIPKPLSKPNSTTSTSSVCSVPSRPYSPGEVLRGVTTDTSTDQDSTVTLCLYPPKTMTPVPKPRRSQPLTPSDLCPPSRLNSETFPILPPLRDNCGTNTFRPKPAEKSTVCRPRIHDRCCTTNLDQSGLVLDNGSSSAQFPSCRSYGFQPSILQSQVERSAHPSSSCPAGSGCLCPNAQIMSPGCPGPAYPLFVQGHRIQTIPSTRSVPSDCVLPKLPHPRNKPRTIVPASIRPSQCTNGNAMEHFSLPPVRSKNGGIPRYFNSCPTRLTRE